MAKIKEKNSLTEGLTITKGPAKTPKDGLRNIKNMMTEITLCNIKIDAQQEIINRKLKEIRKILDE